MLCTSDPSTLLVDGFACSTIRLLRSVKVPSKDLEPGVDADAQVLKVKLSLTWDWSLLNPGCRTCTPSNAITTSRHPAEMPGAGLLLVSPAAVATAYCCLIFLRVMVTALLGVESGSSSASNAPAGMPPPGLLAVTHAVRLNSAPRFR